MRRSIALICVLVGSSLAWGQESESTSVTTRTSGGADLLSQIWNFEDATPLNTGQLDLRLGGRWGTGQSLGDSSDDWLLTPSLVWGACEDVELSLTVKAWLGDGGDVGPFEDGNYDTDLGVLWRLHEQTGFEHKEGYLHLPSIALSGTFRIPTGDGSEKIDGELRLIMTYEYESGIRTHFNAWGKSANGDNFENISSDSFEDFDRSDIQTLADAGVFGRGSDGLQTRDFQYGGVIGADGPLCADGAVRWVADYMYSTSAWDGFSFHHIGEVGFEWEISDASKFGLSVQANLDRNDSQHDWGAGVMYSYTIGS
ncbi:MAG: hypothetical protein IH987_03350 [Planctomycetes bacterium]|nr:hypothetical protein [Planctomycetota bacterium]